MRQFSFPILSHIDPFIRLGPFIWCLHSEHGVQSHCTRLFGVCSQSQALPYVTRIQVYDEERHMAHMYIEFKSCLVKSFWFCI